MNAVLLLDFTFSCAPVSHCSMCWPSTIKFSLSLVPEDPQVHSSWSVLQAPVCFISLWSSSPLQVPIPILVYSSLSCLKTMILSCPYQVLPHRLVNLSSSSFSMSTWCLRPNYPRTYAFSLCPFYIAFIKVKEEKRNTLKSSDVWFWSQTKQDHFFSYPYLASLIRGPLLVTKAWGQKEKRLDLGTGRG